MDQIYVPDSIYILPLLEQKEYSQPCTTDLSNAGAGKDDSFSLIVEILIFLLDVSSFIMLNFISYLSIL